MFNLKPPYWSRLREINAMSHDELMMRVAALKAASNCRPGGNLVEEEQEIRYVEKLLAERTAKVVNNG